MLVSAERVLRRCFRARVGLHHDRARPLLEMVLEPVGIEVRLLTRPSAKLPGARTPRHTTHLRAARSLRAIGAKEACSISITREGPDGTELQDLRDTCTPSRASASAACAAYLRPAGVPARVRADGAAGPSPWRLSRGRALVRASPRAGPCGVRGRARGARAPGGRLVAGAGGR